MFRKSRPDVDETLSARIRAITEASDTPAEAPLQERLLRNVSYRPAKVTFVTGESIDVVVLNHSVRGARIDFISDVQLPEHVLLNAPALGLKTWADVAWQTRGMAGLEFRPAIEASPAS